MIDDTEKFKKEIAGLKALGQTVFLSPLVKETVKQRVLSAVAMQTATQPANENFAGQARQNKLIRYIISTLLGLSFLGGTALAANSAKPGDALFPIKKAEEKIAVSLAVSQQAKAELETKFANRRLQELSSIKAQIQADVKANHQTNENTKHAEEEAISEVSNAINVLTEVQANLENKGNTRAASSVGETLLRLKIKADENKNKEDEDIKKDQGQGQSSQQNNAGSEQDSDKPINNPKPPQEINLKAGQKLNSIIINREGEDSSEQNRKSE